MAVVTTNLGPVTAYGDAVRGGYTGTKEQWEALMADYGTIGTQAQADAQTASTAAQTATTKASEASASATQAQQAAASVSTPDTTLTQSGKAADAKATGDEISALKEDLNAVFVTDSASGSTARFVDGADGVPMKSVKVNIAPVQSGSGDPSPSNVRPITGYDSVKVTRAGKNLLPKYVINPPLYNGVTFTVNSDGSVNANGTASATCNASSADITGIDGEVVLSGCPSDGSATTYQMWIYDKTTNASTAIVDTGNGSTGTLIKDHVYSVRIRIQSGYTVDKTFYPMLRLASDTDDTYEHYNGNTYNISLSSAGTVYGGTLDVVSGVLVVDRAIIDMGDMQWDTVTTSGTLLFRSASIASQIATNDDCISSMFATVKNMTELRNTEASFLAKTSNWLSSNLRTAVHDSRYTDANEFKSAVAGQKIVYPLTEPQTIQLTAQQIASLLGNNNVWSDSGDVEVEYRADTKLYIDKKLGV